jgi:hypothetical protein
LPTIIKAINDNIKKCEEELALLGEPMPVDDAGKMSLLWNMLNEFCDIYRNVLSGSNDEKKYTFLEDEGGHKVKDHFYSLLDTYIDDYDCTEYIDDSQINQALIIHEGDSIPGFPSVDAFYYILRPHLEELKGPVQECFDNVYSYLEHLATLIVDKTFSRFPQAVSDMGEIIMRYLQEERDKCKAILDQVVNMEIEFLFTNDMDYLNKHTTFVPKMEFMQQVKDEAIDTRAIYIREIRERIKAYFNLVVRNLRDNVPKTIGHNLVRSIRNNMQIKLYDQLYKSTELIASLNEPEEIMRIRHDLTRQIKVMRDAQKVIRRDPDLMAVMQISIDDNEIASAETKTK